MQLKKYFQKCTELNKFYTKIKWRQRRVSYGKENPDKTFYVIRRATSKVGLFSYVMTNLGHIKYAVENGYIPIVDMQNNANTYLEECEIGRKNAWEFYFKQPCGYTLSDISRSKNVILGNGIIDGSINFPGALIAHDDKAFALWKQIADNYLSVTDEIDEAIEAERKRLFSNDKMLGVLARGTDYVHSRPYKHPVQPEVQDIITKCTEVMEEYQCKKIYLVTEDKDIFNEFVRVFGNKIVSLDVERYCAFPGENINDVMQRNETKSVYQRGREYLLSVLLLSRCNCLVAGNAGGSQAALLFSNGYEYKYVFDLGVYA